LYEDEKRNRLFYDQEKYFHIFAIFGLVTFLSKGREKSFTVLILLQDYNTPVPSKCFINFRFEVRLAEVAAPDNFSI